jgi:hypothetical protein
VSVDAKRLVSEHLRERIDTRVVGKPPDETDEPWVQVVVLGGPSNFPDYLTAFTVQADCYAGKTGGGPESREIALAVRAALADIAGTHDQGIATGATITGWTELADTDFEPARDRLAITATVWAHP